MAEHLSHIQTNVITGFLGAGKTTAILNLLAKKPSNENWAVLVNEFGEIGIDGGLLSNKPETGIFIREVPGGCMCCAAGLPMQMAMNMLIARAKPTRLIIEPTGLGHPREVMGVLAADHYSELLDLHATLTLVDARKVVDQRYTEHDTFNQQLEIADIIVASKQDLYGPDDLNNLEDFLRSKSLTTETKLVSVQQGELDPDWLSERARAFKIEAPAHGHTQSPAPDAPMVFPAEGFIRKNNRGEGFTSFGWLFEDSFTFSSAQLETLLNSTQPERLKAAMRTDRGALGYNYSGDALSCSEIPGSLEDSRIEIITRATDAFDSDVFDAEAFEAELLRARL